MKLLIFRHVWGVEPPWDAHYADSAAKGYDGIEISLSQVEDAQAFHAQMERHDFKSIQMIYTVGDSVKEHIESFREQAFVASELRPMMINCHSGKDAFSHEESVQFFHEALQIEADLETPVAHETHRGRILYNPWITSRLLDHFVDLKLCSDFSHWVCVCERIIDDQIEIIRQCAERTIHLHARVGFPEGPQVPDPRAPEYQPFVQAHERWWDVIWTSQNERNQAVSTLTPEYGPPMYLHTLPHTNVPVANLSDICDWQATRLREKFNTKFG